MNVFVDDQSPQIRYSGPSSGWRGNSSSDAIVGSYLSGTFTATWVEDAQAEITFRGSGITVYGSRRSNHGVYNVKLDGRQAESFSSFSGPDIIQSILYSVSGLDADQPHTLQITNKPSLTEPKPVDDTPQGSYWLDIDGVSIEGQTLGQVQTKIYDDFHDAFTYSEGWVPSSPAPASEDRYDGTAHGSSVKGTYVDFKFNGSSVQMFGAMHRDHGLFSVSLDGGEAQMLSGWRYGWLTRVSLSAATSLEEGEHTVRLTNLGKQGEYLDIDYAIVNSTLPSSPTSSSSISSTISSSSASTTIVIKEAMQTVSSFNISAQPSTSYILPTAVSQTGATTEHTKSAAIVGSVCGVLVLLTLLIFSFFLYRRRRKLMTELQDPDDDTLHMRPNTLYTIEKDDPGFTANMRTGGGLGTYGQTEKVGTVKGFAARTVSTWSETTFNTTVAGGVSPLVQGLGSSNGRR